jgi:hypothetical protein
VLLGGDLHGSQIGAEPDVDSDEGVGGVCCGLRLSCYMFSMKKKSRRAGATETFSVSVDPETKRALRALADSAFGGNLSALVTDMAEEARRRMAAGAYLRRHGIADPTVMEADALQAEIDREAAAFRKRRPKRRVA